MKNNLSQFDNVLDQLILLLDKLSFENVHIPIEAISQLSKIDE